MSKDKAKHGEWVGTINDPLTELLRSGARALIQQAVEAELQAFLGDYAKVTDLRGRQTVVRNGYLPEREIVTGVGPVAVKIPQGAGSFRRRDQVQLVSGAAVRAQGQAGGSGAAVAVFARHLHGRHAGSAVGAAGL
jgi:hypothetical protein